MVPLYLPRNSPVHRLPGSAKLLFCLAASLPLTFVNRPALLGLALIAIIAAYRLARLPLAAVIQVLRPLLLVGGFIVGLQFAVAGWTEALTAGLRVASLVLLASLVTLTTPLAEMIEILTRAASPLSRFGLSPSRFGLAIALAIRFIPALGRDWHDIQQARLARGASSLSFFALGPLLIKILCMTNVLGDAIASRNFDNRR
jgi:biotin transport system permease protein